MIKKGKHIAVRPDKLIEARYDLTTKQNDILDMVLCQIEDDENYKYELNLNDYKELYNGDTSNIYRDLKKAVEEFEGKGFYLIDSNNKKEAFFVWFAGIFYSDNEGRIVVEIGQTLKKLLVEMKKRIFYRIEYPLNFKSIYSKRIYYYLKSFEDTKWRIDKIDDLRAKLQCPASYNKYTDFKKNVLSQAQKEINNYSDISFEYEEVKTGRKVTAIKFSISKNKGRSEIAITSIALEDPQELQQQSMDDMLNIKLIKAIINETILDIEASKIYNAANGDIDKVKEKYAIVSQLSKVNNVVGAMIKAIKENWTITGKIKDGIFNDYEQRSYDFEELEKRLLGWE